MKNGSIKNISILFSVLCILQFGCDCDKWFKREETTRLNYENIAIYSDLSNRMSKNPNDKVVIDQIKKYFVDDCVKPGKKLNDRSSLSFSRMNFFNSQCGTSKIDIEAVGGLEEKSRFVNNKGQGPTLKKALAEFTEGVNCSYLETDLVGLDILSLLYNEVNSGIPIKFSKSVFDGSDSTIFAFRNHIFIFTDGYLEFSKESGNLSLYFGRPEIDKVRALCAQKGQSPLEVLSSCPNLRLMPLKSENNSLVNLYVLETGDRGLLEEAGTLEYSGDLSDNNILQTAWKLWAIESGFRQFSWKTSTKGKRIPANYIKSMIDKALDSDPLQIPSRFVAYEKASLDCNPVVTAHNPSIKSKSSNSTMSSSETNQERTARKIIPKTIEITRLKKSINSQIFRTTSLQVPGDSNASGSRILKGTYITVLGYAVDKGSVYLQIQSGDQIGFVEKNDIFINDDLKDLISKISF